MQDIPYDTLKKDKWSYAMMLLREQQGRSFASIAGDFGISAIRARQVYQKIKYKQSRLYIRHIAFCLGHETDQMVRQDYLAAYNWYQAARYACAYLEKKYPDILTDYRGGEPGAPQALLDQLPPLRPSLEEAEVRRIVHLRDGQKYPFSKIGAALGITREKAKDAYDRFYHQQVMDRMRILEAEAKGPAEKEAIRQRYFAGHMSAKKRWENMQAEAEDSQGNC